MNTKYSGPEKVAIVLAMLDEKTAGEILRHLERTQAMAVLQQMQRLGRVDQAVADELVKEMLPLLTKKPATQGDPERFASLLNKAFKGAKAEELLAKYAIDSPMDRLDVLDQFSPQELCAILEQEHPQTAAVLLANLEPEKMAQTIRLLRSSLRAELMMRLAKMEAVDHEVLSQLKETLEAVYLKRKNLSQAKRGGVSALVGMLHKMDLASREKMLADLAVRDPKLAAQVAKNLMQFEDLRKLKPKEYLALIEEVSRDTMLKALRLASEPLKERFFASMSERAKVLWREDLAQMKPLPKEQAEEAQREVLEAATQLIKEGKIVSLSNEEYV